VGAVGYGQDGAEALASRARVSHRFQEVQRGGPGAGPPL
jgi:hypothetical protein